MMWMCEAEGRTGLGIEPERGTKQRLEASRATKPALKLIPQQARKVGLTRPKAGGRSAQRLLGKPVYSEERENDLVP
ncbi:hypothetical protein L596_002244 [Steinernema carpocapsae]|uniref:Uncharacterized protein n=1 Tax=Steinernema carpocapsae TaxID=34508 RepID=A0A4U8USM0_STECR|nr:hypothetical protein L596_002244 [Steinernema carpocapsae]